MAVEARIATEADASSHSHQSCSSRAILRVIEAGFECDFVNNGVLESAVCSSGCESPFTLLGERAGIANYLIEREGNMLLH
jgi:hypothetical protein